MNVPLFLCAREDDIKRFLPLLFGNDGLRRHSAYPKKSDVSKSENAVKRRRNKGRAFHRRPASANTLLSAAVRRLLRGLPKRLAAPLRRPLRRFGRAPAILKKNILKWKYSSSKQPRPLCTKAKKTLSGLRFRLRWARPLHRVRLARCSPAFLTRTLVNSDRGKTAPVQEQVLLLKKRSNRLFLRSRDGSKRRHACRQRNLRWGKPLRRVRFRLTKSASALVESIYLPSHLLLRKKFHYHPCDVTFVRSSNAGTVVPGSTSHRRIGCESFRILKATESTRKRRRCLVRNLKIGSGCFLSDVSDALVFRIFDDAKVALQECSDVANQPFLDDLVEDVGGAFDRLTKPDSAAACDNISTASVCRWIESQSNGSVRFSDASPSGDVSSQGMVHHRVVKGVVRLVCRWNTGSNASSDEGTTQWAPCHLFEILSSCRGKSWALAVDLPLQKQGLRVELPSLLNDAVDRKHSKSSADGTASSFRLVFSSCWDPRPSIARTSVFSMYCSVDLMPSLKVEVETLVTVAAADAVQDAAKVRRNAFERPTVTVYTSVIPSLMHLNLGCIMIVVDGVRREEQDGSTLIKNEAGVEVHQPSARCNTRRQKRWQRHRDAEALRACVFFVARRVHRRLAFSSDFSKSLVKEVLCVGSEDIKFLFRQALVPHASNGDFAPMGFASTISATDVLMSIMLHVRGEGAHAIHPFGAITRRSQSSMDSFSLETLSRSWCGVDQGHLVVYVAGSDAPFEILGVVTSFDVQNLVIGQPAAIVYYFPSKRPLVASAKDAWNAGRGGMFVLHPKVVRERSKCDFFPTYDRTDRRREKRVTNAPRKRTRTGDFADPQWIIQHGVAVSMTSVSQIGGLRT